MLPPAPEVNGVKVDLPKLQDSLTNGTPEQQSLVRNAMSGIRYGQYADSLMQLDKLSKDTTLNDQQKQALNQVIEQMKQVVAKAPSR